MAVILPPTPIGVPPGHSFWNDWYEKLRTIVNTGAVSVTWSNINFAGSNITSIASRAHNNLQSMQGGTTGERYHLTAAQHAALGGGDHNDLLTIQGGSSTERYHLTLNQYNKVTGFFSSATDPTTSNISTSDWAIYKNTTSNIVSLWANDGGTIVSVGGGSGTVSSVGMTVPTGLSISGSPITTTGTLAVTYTAGYSIPTDASQANWDTAFGWGNHATAGYLARANHTGTQLSSTISDFDSASRAQTEAELIAGANITITPAGSGASRTLTIASTGGGGGGSAGSPILSWIL
jgi:hypothetical protein